MRKSIYRIVGKLRREKTDNETLTAIKSLSLPTTAKKLSKKLKISEKTTMRRVRRLESQKMVYRKSKNGRNFLIYLGNKKK